MGLCLQNIDELKILSKLETIAMNEIKDGRKIKPMEVHGATTQLLQNEIKKS